MRFSVLFLFANFFFRGVQKNCVLPEAFFEAFTHRKIDTFAKVSFLLQFLSFFILGYEGMDFVYKVIRSKIVTNLLPCYKIVHESCHFFLKIRHSPS